MEIPILLWKTGVEDVFPMHVIQLLDSRQNFLPDVLWQGIHVQVVLVPEIIWVGNIVLPYSTDTREQDPTSKQCIPFIN